MAGVRAAAAELGHRINLVDALGIVLLMAARQDGGYERAAAKWLARLALERPAVRLDDLRVALTTLEALPISLTRPGSSSPISALGTGSTT